MSSRPVLRHQIRRGTYLDSIVLMQLQASLAGCPGVDDAGVVMATPANLDLLAAGGLLPSDLGRPSADDLVIVVAAGDAAAGDEALGRVDELLRRRRDAGDAEDGPRPRSLETALKTLPEARWALVSVPGRYAAEVARRALALDLNVFLYSDNVGLAEELDLKGRARQRQRLVMGPDCGTAVVAGVGLGFANRVRPGPIGLVGASGTGLQVVAARIHGRGAGVSHVLGTGGRDLSEEVGGATALQALALLAADSATRVVVLVSKPPAPAVASRLLGTAAAIGKPAVVHFLGQPRPARRLGALHFATSLSEAAEVAVAAAGGQRARSEVAPGETRRGHLRALFAGGTLAFETLLGVRAFLAPLYSNLALDGVRPLGDLSRSQGHTVLDLGADELTVGRPHPMIDPSLRDARLRRELLDPETGMVLLDVLLGDGCLPDPAGSVARVLSEVPASVPVVALLVGTDLDPQDLRTQRERLEEAGAVVVEDPESAVREVFRQLGRVGSEAAAPGDLQALGAPLAAINVGLESFHLALLDQGARSVHVDWRPPAGGDERLQSILRKMGR